MEQAEQFEERLSKLIAEAKKELDLTDETLVWILLREGLAYYLKTIARIK